MALVWLAGTCALLALVFRKALADAWREPVLRAPVLILESDDRGYGPVKQAQRKRRPSAASRSGCPATIRRSSGILRIELTQSFFGIDYDARLAFKRVEQKNANSLDRRIFSSFTLSEGVSQD